MCCDWYFTGLLNSQVHLIRNLPSLFEPRDYIDILLKPNVFSVHTVSYGTFFFPAQIYGPCALHLGHKCEQSKLDV